MRYLWVFALTPLFAQEVAVPFRAAVATGTPPVVRVLLGVPGATVLGEALSAADSLVAPSHGWAIADAGDGVEIIRWAGGVTRTPLAGAAAGASVRAFSADGAALALYHPASGVLVATGLPDAAQTRPTGFPAGAEALAAMSISDDGQFLMVADALGRVFRWDGAWSAVAGVTGITALDLWGGECLLASSGRELFRWQTDGSVRILAQLPLAPGGRMARSAEGKRAVLTAAGGSALMEINLETLAVTEIPLSYAVSSVSAAPNGEFLLGAEGGDGAWSVDKDLRVSFLPAAKR